MVWCDARRSRFEYMCEAPAIWIRCLQAIAFSGPRAYLLFTTCYPILPTTYYNLLLHITNSLLPTTTYYLLPTTCYLLPTDKQQTWYDSKNCWAAVGSLLPDLRGCNRHGLACKPTVGFYVEWDCWVKSKRTSCIWVGRWGNRSRVWDSQTLEHLVTSQCALKFSCHNHIDPYHRKHSYLTVPSSSIIAPRSRIHATFGTPKAGCWLQTYMRTCLILARRIVSKWAMVAFSEERRHECQFRSIAP